MAAIVVIPARFASTRFPGKPLHPLAGKPMVQHVWERCCRAEGIARVLIATDDNRILDAAHGFGAEAMLTRADHPSGTDRVAEALANAGDFDSVVNVQGDEPLIPSALISQLVAALRSSDAEMATAAAPDDNPEHAADQNIVHVVRNAAGHALYFSRSPIPWNRDASAPSLPFLRHLGIYAYRPDFLQRLVSTPPCAMEKTECLEQLRALDLGARMLVLDAEEAWPGVDTPEQAAALDAQMQHNP